MPSPGAALLFDEAKGVGFFQLFPEFGDDDGRRILFTGSHLTCNPSARLEKGVVSAPEAESVSDEFPQGGIQAGKLGFRHVGDGGLVFLCKLL